jgi:hypothetical protein
MDRTQTLAVGTTLDTKTFEWFLTGTLILVPLIFAGPQLLVGSVTNMLLCLFAITSNQKNWLLKAAALPSLAAVAHGVMFGVFTPFLLYLWPIITLANWVYMNVWRNKTITQPVLRLIAASLLKVAILTIGATLLFQLKVIPAVILTSMGIIQLSTAFMGGLGAILIFRGRLDVK